MPILELRLTSGREIWASKLYIESTYSGLLEGYPIARFNDRTIAGLPARAGVILGDAPVTLIEPVRRIESSVRSGPFGPPEYLPACWIAAEFTSTAIRDPTDASHLIVIWFQEHPFPVPSDAARRRLEALDWETVATDYGL